MNANLIKVAKIAVTVVGMGVTIVSSIVSEKELENKVGKLVAKELAKMKDA